jgi:L-asparaginase II
MPTIPYQPLVHVLRGNTVECIHFGAIAVMDSHGKPIASFGDPQAVTFLRSSAKPFQALPFIEIGGAEAYDLTDREIALMCASHSGTDEHVKVVLEMQRKIGVSEQDLLCGTHAPLNAATAAALQARGEKPGPNRNNCSGKHTGMLAHARLRHLPIENYIDPSHPIQQSILQTVSGMFDLATDQINLGTDGCSVPTFAVPMQNAALAYARLADPTGFGADRSKAIQKITHAMMTNPDMVGGPGRFDTLLMEATEGTILTKSGAEGFQAIAIMPGALGPGSQALGIALKISDGDAGDRAKTTAVVEVLRQLGALSQKQLQALAAFDTRDFYNFRHLLVGKIRPTFELEKHLL